MTILIDPTSTTPLYEQIVQQIQRQILSGTLPQGELLPRCADAGGGSIGEHHHHPPGLRGAGAGRIHQNTARTGQHCKH